MARLIVLDASVAIAALAADDAHHDAATAALGAAADDEFLMPATTRAELLVGPSRRGGPALAAARDFVDGCATVPVTTALADAAAGIRARERALSLPDAIALAVADLLDVDAVWTFDARWASIDERVVIP